jgi:hypothetical protein
MTEIIDYTDMLKEVRGESRLMSVTAPHKFHKALDLISEETKMSKSMVLRELVRIGYKEYQRSGKHLSAVLS